MADRNAPCRCGSGRKYRNCHFRRDKEQETLVAAAKHEAGHVIATLHYDISIGEEGVFITDDGNGFTDSNKTEKWGDGCIFDLDPKIKLAHFVTCFIGPVVEFRHRNMTLEDIEQKHIHYWVADFAAAMGCEGSCRTSTAVMLSPTQFQACGKLTLGCFAMLTHPEREIPTVFKVGGVDVRGELKEAMLVADKMASVYAAEINEFADLLLAKRKVSKDECAEWARNFQRKTLPD